MPHLILETSTNIEEKAEINNLFLECHSLLAKMLPTDIETCKSRLLQFDTFTISNGEKDNAFVHVTLKIMPGRTNDTLQKIGDALIELLKNYFSQSLKKLNLQITIEIVELNNYFKLQR